MKKIIQKLRCKKGTFTSIELVLGILVLCGLILGALEYGRHMSRIQDLQKMANFMAREISLQGAVDGTVTDALSRLESMYNMDVDMQVDGSYIGGNKLQLESDFVVTLTYHTQLAIGITSTRKDKTYVAKAMGTSEEYH